MAVHAAHAHHALLHDHAALVRNVTAVATALLAVASTVALGAAGTEAAFLVIRILTPIVMLGTIALAVDDQAD